MFLAWWQIALIIYFSCNIGCTMMLFVKTERPDPIPYRPYRGELAVVVMLFGTPMALVVIGYGLYEYFATL